MAIRLVKDRRFWLATLLVCGPPVIVMIGTVSLCVSAMGADEAWINTVLNIVIPLVLPPNYCLGSLSLLVVGMCVLLIGRRGGSFASALVLLAVATIIDSICFVVSVVFVTMIAMSF